MDKISREKRRWNMSRIKSRNTKPELKIRKFLYNNGFRYRICYPISGKPDIAFVNKRLAIFIHGCFWHQHGCSNTVIPKTNTTFWKNKLQANISRDIINRRKIIDEGWQVKIIWECEIEKNFKNVSSDLVHFITVSK